MCSSDLASSGVMIEESLKPVNTKYIANIVNPTGTAVVGLTAPASEVRKENPLLVRVGEVEKLSSRSPAIGAGGGTFPFATDDIDGDPRRSLDVGADEYTTARPARHPLTEADVGPNAL